MLYLIDIKSKKKTLLNLKTAMNKSNKRFTKSYGENYLLKDIKRKAEYIEGKLLFINWEI